MPLRIVRLEFLVLLRIALFPGIERPVDLINFLLSLESHVSEIVVQLFWNVRILAVSTFVPVSSFPSELSTINCHVSPLLQCQKCPFCDHRNPNRLTKSAAASSDRESLCFFSILN